MTATRRSVPKPQQPRRGRNTRAGQHESLADRLQVHRRVARTSIARLLQTPASSFVMVCVVAVSLLLPALLFSLNSNIDSLLSGFESGARVTLYLREDVSDADGNGISEDLLTRADIVDVRYVSPAQGLEEFGAASGLQNLLQEMDSNPLPGAIILTPADASPEGVDRLVGELQGIAGVDLVQVDSRWLQRLAAISSLIRTIGRLLSVIVLLGLFFIVGNTIKLAVENRKAEIRVIKLVGGTDLFAARPFLYSGLFYGLAGGVLAVILQAIVLISFNSSLETLLQLYESDFRLRGFGPLNALLLVAAGAVVGWGAALLASLRQIRGISP